MEGGGGVNSTVEKCRALDIQYNNCLTGSVELGGRCMLEKIMKNNLPVY